MSTASHVVSVAAALGILLAAQRAGAAPIQAYNNTGSQTGAESSADLNFNIGHEFEVTGSGIDVQSLGVYDNGGQTLAYPHDVELFAISTFGPSAAATPLAGVTVGAGQSDPSEFVFAPLQSPLLLGDGLYAIVAYNMDPAAGVDSYGDSGGVPDGVSTPNVLDDTYASFRFDPYDFSAPSPVFPTSGDGNFHSSAAMLYTLPTPEPNSMVLIVWAALGICILVRRHRTGWRAKVA